MTISFLKNILSVPNPSGHEEFLAECIENWCRTAGVKCQKDGKGNMYLTKGSPKGFYPGMTAHIDSVIGTADGQLSEVLKAVEERRLLEITDEGGRIKARLDGKDVVVGCDDKNAVAIVLSMFTRLPALKAAFYVEEEMGMKGSRASDFGFWDDVCWVLGFDSPGGNRATHSSSGTILYSDGFFDKYIEPACRKHGVTNFNHEPYTDIKLIREKTKLETFNCRNGGIGAHSVNEYADYKTVCDSEELAYELLTSVPTDERHVSEPGEYAPPPPVYSYTVHTVGDGSGFAWWRSRAAGGRKNGRSDDSVCAAEFEFGNSDQALKFYETVNLVKLPVEIDDGEGTSLTVSGELRAVKRAYALYRDIVDETSYRSFPELERRDPDTAAEFFELVQFEDDDKADFVKKMFGGDDDIEDVEFTMKDEAPAKTDGKNGGRPEKHGELELGDELE